MNARAVLNAGASCWAKLPECCYCSLQRSGRMGCDGQFLMFFVCVWCMRVWLSHTHACFIWLSHWWEICSMQRFSLRCDMLSSAFGYEASTFTKKSRKTARPNTSPDFYFGWGFPPCKGLPWTSIVCDDQTVQRKCSAETVFTQLTIYTS